MVAVQVVNPASSMLMNKTRAKLKSQNTRFLKDVIVDVCSSAHFSGKFFSHNLDTTALLLVSTKAQNGSTRIQDILPSFL